MRKKVEKVFKPVGIITAIICIAVFVILLPRIIGYITYPVVGTVTLTVDGKEVSLDGSEIGIENHMGDNLIEICRIKDNKFRFKRKQYGSTVMFLVLPKEYLNGYTEDLAVEIEFYNNVVAVSKKHDIHIDVTDITDNSCSVSFTDIWNPAYDLFGIIEDELVGERIIFQEKEVAVNSSYISNLYGRFTID